MDDQAAAIQLFIKASYPTAQLATPPGLRVNLFSGTKNETVFLPDGSPRQVIGPQTMADIVVLTPFKYEVRLYPTTAKGTKDAVSGLYLPTGAATRIITIENPDASTQTFNRLHITEADGANVGGGQRDYLYSYTGQYLQFDPAGQWELASQGGQRRETLVSTALDENQNRTETRTVRNQAGEVVSKVVRRYHTYYFGEELVSETVDPDGAALTTTYDYWQLPPVNTGNSQPYDQWGNHLKQKVDPSGHWERYEYDRFNRPTKKVVQFLDAPVNAPDNQCRVFTTSYQDSATPPTDTEVETLQGVEVSRHYKRYLGQGKVQSIVCQHPGAAADAADNLVTTTVKDAEGNVRSTRRPDGTLSTSSQSVANDQKTVVTTDGAPDPSGTLVVDGTRTTTVTDAGGNQLLQTVEDLASGRTLSAAATTQTDALGRPTRLDYADGRAELTGYDCCGVASRTDREGVTTTFTHDALQRLASETRAGITTRYTYDAEGRRLTTVREGSDGARVTLERLGYDVAGRLTSRSDALGRLTTFAETREAATGHPVRTTTLPDAGHSVRVETFFQDGSPLAVGGAAAHPVLYAYGADAALGAWRQEIRVGEGGATSEWTLTYTDAAERDYKTLTAAGALSQSFFNAQGQLVRSVDPDGVVTLYGYNARGEQDTVAVDLDQNGQLDYAGTDRITRTDRAVVPAHGTTVTRTTTRAWTVNGQDSPAVLSVDEQSTDGRRAWHTDAGGLTTSSVTACDGAGVCTTTVTAPDGSCTVGVTSQGRTVAQTRYDANGQVLGGTTLDYDAQGRLWHQSDRRDGPTEFAYDEADQLRRVSHQGQTTGYGYDALGRRTLQSEPDGGQIRTEYWPTGEPKSVVGARTYAQAYTYDAQGRLQTLTTQGAAGAAVTTWHHDAQSGRMVKKAYADGHGPSYTYTPGGRLATRTWARGVVTTYGYNAAGEQQSITYSDGTTAPAAYTYDRLGRLATASGGGSARALAYQGNTSLVTSEAYTAGPLAGISINTGYDAWLRRAGLAVKQGQTSLVTQSFGFDAASRLASASQGTAGAVYGYCADSAANLVQTITFTNDGQPVMTTSKSYDLLDRLTDIHSSVAGASAPVSGFGYGYNAAGQRTRADVAADGTHLVYDYDALGQVTGASRRWNSDDTPVAGQQHGYGYDGIGNRTSTTTNGRQSLYTSNLLNQYSQRTVPGAVDVLGQADPAATVTLNGQAVTRQAGGYFAGTVGADNTQGAVDVPVDVVAAQTNITNVLSEQKGGVLLPKTPEQFAHDLDGNLTQDGRWTYAWDAENRLVGLAALGSVPVAERRQLAFAYDDLGRRVRKQTWTWDAATHAYEANADTRFASDGWNLVAELAGASGGALERSYLWGLDLSGSLQGAGGVGGLLAVIDHMPSTGAQSHFACFDGNGNVAALVKASDGSPGAQYQYGPFGEVIRATGPLAQANPMRWSTKYTDPESGLSYYGCRFYDSITGSWINRDLIGEEGGVNVYGFVHNDGVNTSDFLGLADVNILLTRNSYGYFNTYGEISVSSDNTQATQCCGLPKAWKTLELPWAKHPYALQVGTSSSGHRNPTLVPMRTQPSGNPGLVDAKHTTPTQLNGGVPPPQPAGVDPSDYDNAINHAFNTGNGDINVHAGTGSWSSLFCIIIGHTYVPVITPPPKARSQLPGVAPEPFGTRYYAYGFDYQDSLQAQTEFNAAIACVARSLKRTPTVSFKFTPHGEPPFAGVLVPPVEISR